MHTDCSLNAFSGAVTPEVVGCGWARGVEFVWRLTCMIWWLIHCRRCGSDRAGRMVSSRCSGTCRTILPLQMCKNLLYMECTTVTGGRFGRLFHHAEVGAFLNS